MASEKPSSKKKSEDDNNKDQKYVDMKEELLLIEIKKFEKNIEYIKDLIAAHQEYETEDKKDAVHDGVLDELKEDLGKLQKELYTKRLELISYRDKKVLNKERKDKIQYDDLPNISAKNWLKRFKRWKREIAPSEKSEEKSKNANKKFKPYKHDIFLRFTYDIVGKKIMYPFNCFFISFILLPFLVLPFYFILGPESFYIEGETIGVFESTTFMMVIILIPAVLIVLRQIFKQYEQTFKDLRNVAKVSNDEYQEFISLSNWTLQSPTVKYFWIGAWIFVVIFGVIFFNNPKPTDLIDDVGLIGLISMIVIYSITATIAISLSWYLLSLVRIIRRFTMMPLDIRPLDPDGAAGLKPLSALSFNLSMVSLLGVAGLIFGLFLGGRGLFEPQTILFLASLIFFMVILFLLPLSNAHNVMDEKKSEILRILSSEHALAYRRIREEIPKAGPSIKVDTLTELQGIAELYDRANDMPVWPFDFKTVSNLIAAIGLPLLLIFLEELLLG